MADRKFISEHKAVLDYPFLTSEEEALINKSKKSITPEAQNKKEETKTPITPKKTFTYKKSVSALGKLFSTSKKTKRKPSNLSTNLRKNFAFPRAGRSSSPLKKRGLSRRDALLLAQLKKNPQSNRDWRAIVQRHREQSQQDKINSMKLQRELSPNTKLILENLRNIQTKGFRDDERMMRLIHERRAVAQAGNLLKAHENMKKVSLDFTGVNPEENILFAPNTFKENPEDMILRPKSSNILSTKRDGNNLNFFGGSY